MTISWTHTVEDRLQRLESRHERLQARVLALAETLPADRAAAGDRAPGAGAGAVGPGQGQGTNTSGAAGSRAGVQVKARVVDPGMVTAARPVTYMPQPGGRWVARPAAPGGGEPAAAGAAPGPHPAPPQPIGGGQTATRPALGMWVPPPRMEGGQLARRDRRPGIRQRLHTLTDSARRLSSAVQRLETMVTLMAQVVTVAVDPSSRPEAVAPGSSGGSDSGSVVGSLLGLLGTQGGTGGGGEGSSGGAAGGDDGSGGGQTVQGLAALLPLLEQLTGSPGQARTASVGALLGSPAFQQLVSMIKR